MTKGERRFTHAVIALTAVLVLFLIVIMLDWQQIKGEFAGGAKWVLVPYLGCLVAVYVKTAVSNLQQDSLQTTQTIVQCVFLCLFPYGIFLAIWGVILLVRKRRAAISVSIGDGGNPSPCRRRIGVRSPKDEQIGG